MPKGKSGTGRRSWAVALFLALIVFAVFRSAAHFEYTNIDDHEYVSENPLVQGGLSPAGVGWAFRDTHLGNWHPLTWLSLMGVVELFGPGPGPQHLLNVILHMLNALLLFLLLREMTGETLLSTLTAALFAVHPLHVETVAWVSERKGVLSALFFLLALLSYANYARKPSILRYLSVAGAYLLGLMSKPIVITLPALLLLLDYWPLRRLTLRRGDSGESPAGRPKSGLPGLLAEKAPLFLMAALFGAGTFLAQQKTGAVATLESFSLGSRATMVLSAYTWYLGKMLVPSHLAAFYPVPGQVALWKTALNFAALAGLSILAAGYARRLPYLPVALLWYVVMLFPVSGVITIGLQNMADRYSYLSLIGPLVAVVWGVRSLAGQNRIRRGAAAAAAVAALVVLSRAAHVQTGYWSSSLSIHTRSLAVTRENWVAHFGLGKYYADRGQYEKAMRSFEEAIRIEPSYPGSYMPLCLLYLGGGDVQSAMALYRQLKRYDAEAAARMLTFIRYASGG